MLGLVGSIQVGFFCTFGLCMFVCRCRLGTLGFVGLVGFDKVRVPNLSTWIIKNYFMCNTIPTPGDNSCTPGKCIDQTLLGGADPAYPTQYWPNSGSPYLDAGTHLHHTYHTTTMLYNITTTHQHNISPPQHNTPHKLTSPHLYWQNRVLARLWEDRAGELSQHHPSLHNTSTVDTEEDTRQSTKTKIRQFRRNLVLNIYLLLFSI